MGAAIFKNLNKTRKEIFLDYDFLRHECPRIRNVVSACLFNPGFRSLMMFRIQTFFSRSGVKRLAQLVSGLNLSMNGSEFCVGASISAPTIVRHPAGIVVGGGVQVGTHCILLQGVTLGQAGIYNNSESKYPRIGNHVAFGAYSAALGNISIHDNTLIGAHSVLVNSTVESGLYVGIPAKFVRKEELDEQ